VIYHTEIMESSGFVLHWKLPHYVTFASALDSLRGAREGGVVKDKGKSKVRKEPTVQDVLRDQIVAVATPGVGQND
jgi:alpha-D-ribose 1-methylphosphonate 5-triphosphate synthase subunit PhnI